jgi:hypothetical protein
MDPSRPDIAPRSIARMSAQGRTLGGPGAGPVVPVAPACDLPTLSAADHDSNSSCHGDCTGTVTVSDRQTPGRGRRPAADSESAAV